MPIMCRKQGTFTESKSEFTLKAFYFVTRINTALLDDFQKFDNFSQVTFLLFSSFFNIMAFVAHGSKKYAKKSMQKSMQKPGTEAIRTQIQPSKP